MKLGVVRGLHTRASLRDWLQSPGGWQDKSVGQYSWPLSSAQTSERTSPARNTATPPPRSAEQARGP